MRFLDKIKKLGDPRLPASMKHHARRILLTRRFAFRINPDTVIASIDPEQFRAIHARHAVPNPGDAPEKYLELRRWLEVNIRRLRELDLDLFPRRRILDIGSGAGYFLYLCKRLGHDVLGLDLDESPMFNDLTELLGVPRVIARIERYKPLPKFDAPFDLITAYMICFNDHKTDHIWGPDEWEFFLNDAAQYLRPTGIIHLELNQEFDGTSYTPALRDYFERRGATVVNNRVTLTPDSRAPRAIASASR
ncbi:MAG: methyltransferase domain-containing protein [Chthoniobacterales bacterium]